MGTIKVPLLLAFTLSLLFINLSEARHGKELPSAVVVGTVYCDTCFQQDFTKASHFISGASVAVKCSNGNVKTSYYKEVKTNEHGEFEVHLPTPVSKHVKTIEGCSVKLIHSSDPFCAVASLPVAPSLHLKGRKEGTHIFSAGLFTFKPVTPPEFCNKKPAVPNSKGLGSNKSLLPTLSLPTLPIPTIPTVPSLPIQLKATETSKRTLYDKETMQPTFLFTQVIPPVLPTPTIPTVPPVLPTPGLPTVPPTLPTPGLPTVPPILPTPGLPTVPPVLPTPGLPTIPPVLPTPGLPTVPPVLPTPGLPTVPPVLPTPGLPTVPPVLPTPGLPTVPPVLPTPGLPTVPPVLPTPGLPTIPPVPPTPGLPTVPPVLPTPDLPPVPPVLPSPGLPTEPPVLPSPGLPTEPPVLPTPGLPTAPPVLPTPGLPTIPPVLPPPSRTKRIFP